MKMRLNYVTRYNLNMSHYNSIVRNYSPGWSLFKYSVVGARFIHERALSLS